MTPETTPPEPGIDLAKLVPPAKPPKMRVCNACGHNTPLSGPCVECGAKPKLVTALLGQLTAMVNGTTETGDKRGKILIALSAIAAAAVALGFEFSRTTLQVVVDTAGQPILGPDGQMLTQVVGASEAQVAYLIVSIVGGLYTLGDRIWGYLEKRRQATRKLAIGGMVLLSMITGGLGSGGCAMLQTREVVAHRSVEIQHVEEPCELVAIADGDEVFRLRWEHKCPIETAPTFDPPSGASPPAPEVPR